MAANIEKTLQEMKVSVERYILPPLVILITEEDGSPFEWLLRNNEALQKLGYNTINIELPFDIKLKEFLELQNTAKRMKRQFEMATYKSEPELDYAFMLCGMKNSGMRINISALLEFLSKDSQLGKDKRKWRYNFIDVSVSILDNHMTNIDAIRKSRDKNFAANISQSSNQAGGGTITFLGNMHYKVYDELLLINPVCAKESQFITMEKLPRFNFKHTGTCSSPEKFNDECKKNYLRNTSKRKENLQAYFPSKKYLPVDFSNDTEIPLIDKIIMRKITLLSQTLNPMEIPIVDFVKSVDAAQKTPPESVNKSKNDENKPAIIFSLQSDQSNPAKETSSKKKRNKKRKNKP